MKNQGYAVDPKLAKDLKIYAVVNDRKLYDVMNEAIAEFLARHPRPY